MNRAGQRGSRSPPSHMDWPLLSRRIKGWGGVGNFGLRQGRCIWRSDSIDGVWLCVIVYGYSKRWWWWRGGGGGGGGGEGGGVEGGWGQCNRCPSLRRSRYWPSGGYFRRLDKYRLGIGWKLTITICTASSICFLKALLAFDFEDNNDDNDDYKTWGWLC